MYKRQELVRAVAEMGDRLEIVSAERVRDELDKLLVVEDPSDGLWFLVETGLADEFLPELLQMRLEQDPIHHHKDVLAHTIAVVAKTRPCLLYTSHQGREVEAEPEGQVVVRRQDDKGTKCQ